MALCPGAQLGDMGKPAGLDIDPVGLEPLGYGLPRRITYQRGLVHRHELTAAE